MKAKEHLLETDWMNCVFCAVSVPNHVEAICTHKKIVLEEKRMKRISPIQDRIERFYNYLLPWKHRDISIADYIKLRTPKYPELIDSFKKEYFKYKTQYSEGQLAITIAKLREIEDKELTEIYGGPRLQITEPLL